jgi:hypothetical protein
LITLGKNLTLLSWRGLILKITYNTHIISEWKESAQLPLRNTLELKEKNNATYDEFELYKRLFGGETIKFNLGVNNKVKFQKSKDQEFYTYSKSFTRKVTF